MLIIIFAIKMAIEGGSDLHFVTMPHAGTVRWAYESGSP